MSGGFEDNVVRQQFSKNNKTKILMFHFYIKMLPKLFNNFTKNGKRHLTKQTQIFQGNKH